MNKFIKFQSASIVIIMATMALSSCKKSFDNPPADVAPTSIKANTTIQQLKARHTVAGSIDKIDSGSDIIIRGIVIGDDRSGNLYKNIVIQDSTGGIAVLINGSNLYTSYPIGREIFIKCNNLYLSDYSNQIQLGGGIQVGSTPGLSDISTPDNYIFKGTLNNVVTPTVVTVGQLGTTMQDKYQNTLIQLNDYKFSTADLPNTFASAGVASPSAASFKLYPCSSSSSSIELRTSNYANFAATPLPSGIGSITAIYTLYRTTKQLTVRDASDVKFTGTTCGTTPPPPPPPSGGTTLLSENFESQVVPAAAPFNAIAVSGWFNDAEVGGKKFEARTFSSNKYAQLSAFGSNQATVTSWLVTKGVNLGSYATKTLSFSTSGGYANGATLKVFVSSNYTGTGNPWTSGVTWTDLTSSATLCTIPSSGYFSGFTPSGNISLNSYTGTIYVAFKYEGADPTGTANDKTTTWQVDNILVTGN